MNSTGIAAWGGGEKWMLQTGTELQNLGHKIFYGGRQDSHFLKKCTESGFSTLPLNIGSDFDPFVIKKLISFFKKQNINIIVAEQNKDIRLVGASGSLLRKRVLVARTGLASIKNKRRYRLLFPRLLDGIIVTTRAIKQKYLSYKWLKSDLIQVIPNGIFPSPYPVQPSAEIKKQFALPEDKQIVGIFGKLIPQKQHVIFLEIAANVLKHFPNTLFLIVGDGPEREKLQNYAFDLGILDNVYLTGFQDNTLPIYSICDLVLLTSHSEGLPDTVMEAMLMKRPVIAFDVGGVSELITPEKNGILVPPNDIYLMTQRVEQLLMDEYTAENIGNDAREFILNNFSIDKTISQIEKYFTELLRKKTRRGKWNVKFACL